MNNSEFRSPLKNVRGLGTAKSGTHHFIIERLTAIALIPLGLWFVISILGKLLDGKVTSLVMWLESPFNAILLALFVFFSFWHSMTGVQVIIEDYCHKWRIPLLLFNKTAHILLGAMTLLAVISLHFQPAVVL